MKERNIIQISQNQLNEMIEATVNQLISEGVFDKMKSAWDRFANGYEVKEGNPESVEDVFEGNGWKVITAVPKQNAMYYFVRKQTGALGAFYGQEAKNMVQELNTFLGRDGAKYIGTHPDKKYLEIFRIA